MGCGPRHALCTQVDSFGGWENAVFWFDGDSGHVSGFSAWRGLLGTPRVRRANLRFQF